MKGERAHHPRGPLNPISVTQFQAAPFPFCSKRHPGTCCALDLGFQAGREQGIEMKLEMWNAPQPDNPQPGPGVRHAEQ